MKKFNFRPLFYFAIMFVLALVLSRQIFSLSIFHIVLSIVILGGILYLCIKYKCTKRFVALLAVFAFGLGYSYIAIALFNNKTYDSEVVVSARVKSVYDGGTYHSYILDNVKINLKNQRCCISLTINDGDPIPQGQEIYFEGKLKNTKLLNNGEINSYYYKNNIGYKCYAKYSEITQKNNYKKLNEKIILSFDELLNKYMSEEISGLVTCVLFGDKAQLTDEVNYAYNSSGMAHLLAVSGMHIMLLINIITILLKKIKIKRIIKFFILAIVLTFFTYICDFEPSIVRALIMGLIFSLSNVVGKKYDRLNSMGLCAIIMLLISPFSVFDAGFVLSFMCVFCIFTLQKPTFAMLKKIKMNEKLAEGVSVVLAVQIGLLPVVTIYSQNFNIFSLLINFICVPIFESIFVVTLAVVPICAILPFLGFVLKFLEFIYAIITMSASWIGALSWANVILPKFNEVLILSTYTSIFITSGYINEKSHKKWAYSCMLMAVGFLGTFFSLLN